MSRSRRILAVALIAATAAAVAVIVIKFRKMDEVATETADDIEMQLDALDPITRAAVVEKLSARAVEGVEARRS
jgi:hypothetical protein